MKEIKLKSLISEEIQKLKEGKKIPKKNTIDYHEHKIAVDTVKNPLKAKFLGGLSVKDAIKTLKRKFGYSDEDIKKLQQ